MTEQLSLDAAPVTLSQGRPLTPKQEAVWRLARATPGGVTAEEAGALLHASRGSHPADQFCSFCFRDGLSVLRSKAVAPLVVRRRASGRYEPRDPVLRARERGSQLDGLPDWLAA